MALKMLVFDFRKPEKDFFANNNFENLNINFYEHSLNEEIINELSQEIMDETSIISVFKDSEVTSNVITKFKNLRLISTRSTGYNHINTTCAKEKNIAVVNVENYDPNSIVQFTFGLIIALVRKIIPSFKYINNIYQDRENKFSCADFVGQNITDMVLGIVGTGAIGSEICKIANNMGMKVIANDIVSKNELLNTCDVEYSDLESLLRNSDIVTLHLPYTGNNYHMFSKHQFSIMKKGAYFINTSRGELVNTKDLYNVLKSGHLAGAALDAVSCENYNFRCNLYAEEKKGILLNCAQEHKILGELLELPNVIITPHIAYATQESIDHILNATMEGILDYIMGGHKHRVV